jgi:hypothetical protein
VKTALERPMQKVLCKPCVAFEGSEVQPCELFNK